MPRTAPTARRPGDRLTQGDRAMTPVTAPPSPAPYLPQRGERYRLVVPNAPTAPRIVRDFVATVLWAAGHAPSSTTPGSA